eukprot:9144820-Ditylum_brightwellii.AAC.1
MDSGCDRTAIHYIASKISIIMSFNETLVSSMYFCCAATKVSLKWLRRKRMSWKQYWFVRMMKEILHCLMQGMEY